MGDQMAAMLCLLSEEMRSDPSHKIIIFTPTARQTQFVAEALGAAGVKALEIHSRKSQAHRTKTSDQFRAAKCAVMVSSDVSARGVDYPDVTLVVQVGAPPSSPPKSGCAPLLPGLVGFDQPALVFVACGVALPCALRCISARLAARAPFCNYNTSIESQIT